MIDQGSSSSMTVFAKTVVLSSLAALTFGSGVCAQTVEREFTTSTGHTVILSPIKGMECPEIDKMLARIDSTRYREHAPTPHSADDAPLFEYELLLAEESYNRCVVVRKKVTSGIIFMQRSKSE